MNAQQISAIPMVQITAGSVSNFEAVLYTIPTIPTFSESDCGLSSLFPSAGALGSARSIIKRLLRSAIARGFAGALDRVPERSNAHGDDRDLLASLEQLKATQHQRKATQHHGKRNFMGDGIEFLAYRECPFRKWKTRQTRNSSFLSGRDSPQSGRGYPLVSPTDSPRSPHCSQCDYVYSSRSPQVGSPHSPFTQAGSK
jgi:hypothetical protein